MTKQIKAQWVKSSTDKNKKYFVRNLPNGDIACSCPHFVFRNTTCKHLKKVLKLHNEKLLHVQKQKENN